MGKAKTCTIGDKTVTVRELTLREIKTLTESVEQSPVDALTNLLTVCTDVKKDDLEGQPPSELTAFVDTLIEVNTPFFDMAEAVNMSELATAIKNLMRSVFLIVFSPSSKEDTE